MSGRVGNIEPPAPQETWHLQEEGEKLVTGLPVAGSLVLLLGLHSSRWDSPPRLSGCGPVSALARGSNILLPSRVWR